MLTQIRKNILRMAHYSHASHVGAALSVADILYVLYFKIARITPQNAVLTDRDKVILSKGHASTALYSVLAAKKLLDSAYLDRYYMDGGVLPGHLDKDAVPGIDASAGSLGHGLSLGMGMALAKPQYNVYVVMGDGECNEGSVWEAAGLAPALGLKNLTLAVDANRLQGFARAEEVSAGNLADKFRAFGWKVLETDGHDTQALECAFRVASSEPKAVIAHTCKGKGVSFMENELKWHYKSPNDDELKQAFSELDAVAEAGEK